MKKTIGILAVLFCLMFVSNALAVNLAWDPQSDSDGFYLYWYLEGATPSAKVEIPGKTAVTGSIGIEQFQEGPVYNIHATAWANPVVSGDPRPESGPSNVVKYVRRSATEGGNLGLLPGKPTGLDTVGTEFVWVAPAGGAGIGSPMGYTLYYFKTAIPGTLYNIVVTPGTTLKVAMSALTPVLATNVSYTAYVKAYVYGIDGYTILEGPQSDPLVFTPTGGSGTLPKAPGKLRIN